MIGLAYGPAPTIPGVYVLTLVILVFSRLPFSPLSLELVLGFMSIVHYYLAEFYRNKYD